MADENSASQALEQGCAEATEREVEEVGKYALAATLRGHAKAIASVSWSPGA